MQLQENKTVFEEVIEKKEYYEIRLESIGGLGANLLGKMLGELGLKYLGVNSSSFSSYGSEKTGTPVKGFIRYGKSEKEIRVHSPIVTPDLLVIFHQALCKEENVWKGCHKETKVLVALETGQEMKNCQQKGASLYQESEETCLKEGHHNSHRFYGIEAQKIAIQTKSRINVVLLGAILKIMGLETPEVGEQICKETLGKKYPQSLEKNLEGLRRGFEEVKQMNNEIFCESEGANSNQQNTTAETKENHKLNQWAGAKELGYLNAPIGGINLNPGSTVTNDLSPSRQGYIPLFLKEKCINCGLCFSACPDMVFQFVKGKYKGKDMMINQGLDYYHCKGCLRCVDVCPVNALVMAEEAKQENKPHFMPNQELLRLPKYYEKSGADGYITSESYLTEERMEGGEV